MWKGARRSRVEVGEFFGGSFGGLDGDPIDVAGEIAAEIGGGGADFENVTWFGIASKMGTAGFKFGVEVEPCFLVGHDEGGGVPFSIVDDGLAGDCTDPADIEDESVGADEERLAVRFPGSLGWGGGDQRTFAGGSEADEGGMAWGSKVEGYGLGMGDNMEGLVGRFGIAGAAGFLAGDEGDVVGRRSGAKGEELVAFVYEALGRCIGDELCDAEFEGLVTGFDAKGMEEDGLMVVEGCLDGFEDRASVDLVAEDGVLIVEVVTVVLEPLGLNGTAWWFGIARDLEGVLKGPLPGGEAWDAVAIDFGHLFTTLEIVVGLGEVEKTAGPSAGETHAVEVVADGDLMGETKGEGVVDGGADLGAEDGAVVALTREDDFISLL